MNRKLRVLNCHESRIAHNLAQAFYMREKCFDNCRTCSFSESWLHCGRFTKWRCRCRSVL